MLNYSVTIRTLGKAGDKYVQTIKSIEAQNIKPKEIIVIIDDEKQISQLYKCGLERFVVKPRGMVKQRLFGIAENKSDWLLMLDDDVKFGPLFVNHLYDTAIKAKSDVVIPIVKQASNGEHNNGIIRNFVNNLMGIGCKGNIGNYYIKIMKTGGFCINNRLDHDKQYYSQSGHGTCCFANTHALDNLHFEEELWLEHTPYSLPEDQVMFYKFFCKGFNIAVNLEENFYHLDAQSSQPKADKILKLAYASAHNGYIFWHRFIYLRTKGFDRLSCLFALWRRELFVKLFAFLKGIVKCDMSKFRIYCKAYSDARKFVRSENYKILPKI